MKAFKAFIKPFEAPQGSKMKIRNLWSSKELRELTQTVVRCF